MKKADKNTKKMLKLLSEIGKRVDELQSLATEENAEDAMTQKCAALLLRTDEIKSNLDVCKNVLLQKQEEPPMSKVYAGPRRSRSDSMNEVYAAPEFFENKSAPEVVQERETEPMACVYAAPDFPKREQNPEIVPETIRPPIDLPMAPTYAAPQFTPPAGAFSPVEYADTGSPENQSDDDNKNE